MPNKLFLTGLTLSLLITLSSCGTLLYPERQGQKGGKIDPAVAILDGVGLILFLIPGLVAFAVDFHTGAIYLDESMTSKSDATPEANAIKGSQKSDKYRKIGMLETFNKNEIDIFLTRELGIPGLLDNKALLAMKIDQLNHSLPVASAFLPDSRSAKIDH